ncbi:MAG: magnesium transporter [Anaerolineales bacterium]|nr:magnesium transporter [Anaerolineales bacterium]
MSQLAKLSPIAELIHRAFKNEQFAQGASLFLRLHPADQADVFEILNEENRSQLLRHLDIPTTADLFDELEDQETAEAAEFISLERLGDVLDEMDPDQAADLLGDLSPEIARLALTEMDEPEDVLPLLEYPDETAGGRMTTAFLCLHPQTTTAEAIEYLREANPDTDVPYYLFVSDETEHLVGVLGLRELVIADPQTTVDEVMDRDVIKVSAMADQEEAARLMTHYDLTVLPVTDAIDQLVGVITHDDILDVIEDEATEDIYRLASVADTDLEPESAVVEQIKGRLPWLLLNTATALFAAWIISMFEDLFVKVAVLAFFQSVVAGQGGSAASQNVAMIVRSLALGKIETKRVWAILLRQLWIGLLQGIIIGVIIGLGVGIWQGNPYLGIVLGLALVGNMLVAGIVGTLLPLAFQYIGQDPAMTSSVLVTAATDALGFLIFLSLAKMFLPLIIQYLPY